MRAFEDAVLGSSSQKHGCTQPFVIIRGWTNKLNNCCCDFKVLVELQRLVRVLNAILFVRQLRTIYTTHVPTFEVIARVANLSFTFVCTSSCRQQPFAVVYTARCHNNVQLRHAQQAGVATSSVHPAESRTNTLPHPPLTHTSQYPLLEQQPMYYIVLQPAAQPAAMRHQRPNGHTANFKAHMRP